VKFFEDTVLAMFPEHPVDMQDGSSLINLAHGGSRRAADWFESNSLHTFRQIAIGSVEAERSRGRHHVAVKHLGLAVGNVYAFS